MCADTCVDTRAGVRVNVGVAMHRGDRREKKVHACVYIECLLAAVEKKVIIAERIG